MTDGTRQGPRIWVVGISGSGKTTVAAQAAARLGIPHLQLDGFCGGTTAIPRPEVRQRVAELLKQEAWVADGNHPVVRDLLTTRATDIVLIDLPRALVVAQVIWRWLSRAITGRWIPSVDLQASRAWLDRRHDIPWGRSTFARRQVELSALVDRRGIRLRSRRVVRAWVESLPSCEGGRSARGVASFGRKESRAVFAEKE